MCGTLSVYPGWRLYMEDAHISVAPFSDKKLALFGVFDGHGGKDAVTQELSALCSCSDISPKN